MTKNKNNSMNKQKPNKASDDSGGGGGGGGGGKGGRAVVSDPRFAALHWDPRFQKVSKHKAKVAIDSRFNRMFTDPEFASATAPVDKRGKPKKKTKKQTSADALRRYYQLEEEEEEEESEREELGKSDDVAKKAESGSELDSSESESESEEDDVESTTDEEDGEGDDVAYEEEEDVPEAEVENVPVIEDGTRRLAVVNMDWRHVRAVDLYVVLGSFLPKGGEIVSVSVYPSEFGLQRMKEEELHGPVGLYAEKKERNDDDDDDDEGDDDDDGDGNDGEIDSEKLRAYEKSRLRYYYAVVECDSVATAEYLYKACDGVEFERSSNVLDLRFIPDSMEFKHSPRDVAKQAPSSYEGLDFHTKALQHSNVPISWDEDEPQRVKTLRRKFTADQLAELELKEFLASDESETDEEEDDNAANDQSDKKHKKLDKYRALIEAGDGSDEDSEDEGRDMEITFNTELEGLSKRILEKKDRESETLWEAHLRKKREKKKARRNKSKYSSEEDDSDADVEGMEQHDDFFVEELSVKKGENKEAQGKKDKEKQLQDKYREAEASRAELELLLADDKGADNGLRGYNLKRKKEKGKKGKEVPENDKIPIADYDDPRFSALFTSPFFALDPTDPQFKRSAAYARHMAKQQHNGDGKESVERENKKQRPKAPLPSDENENNKVEHMNSDVLPSKKEKHELSALVRSIKKKSIQVQSPSNCNISRKDEKLQPRGRKEKPELSASVQPVKKKTKVHTK